MQENIPLKNYTTLRLGGKVRYFFVCKNESDIVSAVGFAHSKNLPMFPLGGGSNVVVSDVVADMVCLKLENKGIEIIDENRDTVLVRASAGEIWDNFVDFAVLRNFSGIEALSAIPGTCGASPIQNIGAYGAEVSQTIETVRFYNIEKEKFEILSNVDCRFGYRNSIFKHELKGMCIIESVVFKLSKHLPKIPSYPRVDAMLAEVQSEFPEQSLLKHIRTTIQRIRSGKLPDPKHVANVGSFFKNIFVDMETKNRLVKNFPDMPTFPFGNTHKIPAGWLIEKADYKGFVSDNVGVYPKNALVLVNNSAEKTENLLSLASKIQTVIKEKFDLDLEIEPEIIV